MGQKLITEEKKESFALEAAKDLFDYPFIKERSPKIAYGFAKEYQLLPLQEDEKTIWVAVVDPFCLEPLDELKLLLKKEIKPLLTSKSGLELAIRQCYHQNEEETKQLFTSSLEKGQEKEEASEGVDLLEKKEENPVIRMLNALFIEAIQEGASDIHFEPQAEGMQVRYRIDGMLLKRHEFLKEVQSQILTRIKVLSQLDIAEHRLPQDGRIKLKMGGREIDFRVSTIPVIYGERAVLRILDRSNVFLGLSHLGMKEKICESFRRQIHTPEGIVLVTGPTGSGKTTTLYSALHELHSSEKNIMTIEDPVEYKIPRIAQIGVNPKISLNFAKGLRHILRQDPDVIMIGEIRDQETAEIAIQAALTGHLVLSTLHTNDAPSAIVRLIDMGVEPYLLTSSIVAVLAQRLVRKICPFCREGYTPSEEELRTIGMEETDSATFRLYHGKGCKECFQTGFKGRCGIYELMEMSSSLKRQILKGPQTEEIKNIASLENMIDLFHSGIELVLLGITTLSELVRVTKMQR
jgi:general secretion pathway protein E